MSIKIMNEVIEAAPVEQGALLVLIMLADSADERSRECWPSVSNIAKRSRLSERQVQYCLKDLADRGMIEIVPNAGRSGTNLYRVTQPATWGGAITAGVKPIAPGGVQSTSPGGVKPIAPEPSLEPSIEPSTCERGQLTLLSEDPTPAKVDRFDEFWSVYPRKTAKEAARKAWPRVSRKADPDKIIAAARRYAEKRAGEDERYTAHPATWLNAGSYDDADLQPVRAAPVQRYYPGGVVR